jgi:hypothetical protein
MLASQMTAKLKLRDTVRDMARTYRSEFGLLIVAALVVFVPLSMIEAVASRLEDVDTSGLDAAQAIALGGVVLIHAATSLLGDCFYSGVVAAAVTRLKRGEVNSLRVVARSLRYGRLLAVDLSYDVLLAVGLLLLVGPGVLVFGWFSLTAATVEIEDRSFVDSFRRSRELVRHNFWRVMALLLPIAAITDALTSTLEHALSSVLGGPLAGDWAANLFPELALAPFWGLAAAVLTYDLARIKGRQPAPE